MTSDEPVLTNTVVVKHKARGPENARWEGQSGRFEKLCVVEKAQNDSIFL